MRKIFVSTCVTNLMKLIQTCNTVAEMLQSYRNFSDGTDVPSDQFDNNNGTYTSLRKIDLPAKKQSN
jgi:hypothetical protein